MSNKPRRKTVFIKKRFQTDFSVKFLVLIAAESLLAVALFGYLSRGTFITGFTGSDIVIAKTGDYFLPTLLLANLLVIGATAAAGFIVMLYASHKIAGPLYRFEQSLDEIGAGDLTHRFTLRSKDQLGELAGKMNEFSSRLEGAVAGIKGELGGLDSALSAVKAGIAEGADRQELLRRVEEAKKRIEALEKAAGFFKTTRGRQGR